MSDYKNEILAEADRIINGERNEQYGEPEDCFASIAAYWNKFLSAQVLRVLEETRFDNDKYIPSEVWDKNYLIIDKHDVAMMMILLKVARTNGTKKKDNYVDIAGYAALAARM